MMASVDNSMCMELALEGERLCKSGDCRAGVSFLEAAIRTETDDMKMLSAIYSQLGNAYFYMGEYGKALEYHKNDLTLARSMNDRIGEAKASGNVGNTLKILGRYDEAIICCRRHLDISRELSDRVGEARALYNLGNVYHAKGKYIGKLGHQDPGEFPEEVKSCLEKAVEYYKANLVIVTELLDRPAQGRACGNLGNTYYLLGSFRQAISYHEERLNIAEEVGDKAAKRRAYCNMGNAHIFLGEFELAADHYKKALILAQEIQERALEAQACYSLGNTYTLLHDYPTAVEYHLLHLSIAHELADKIGEARACWSLGNAHSAVGNHEKALHYAHRHLDICKELGDLAGQATAQLNVADFRKLLSNHGQLNSTFHHDSVCSIESTPGHSRTRRVSMENMDLLKLTPEIKNDAESKVHTSTSQQLIGALPEKLDAYSTSWQCATHDSTGSLKGSDASLEADQFFELLCNFQSNRMDDQRCPLNAFEDKENHQSLSNFNHTGSNTSSGSSTSSGLCRSADIVDAASSNVASSSTVSSSSGDTGFSCKEELLDLIAGLQSKRMDEQRASLPHLPGLNNNNNNYYRTNNNNNVPRVLQRMSSADSNIPDDSFFDMLMRCQSTRLEDQRSVLPVHRRSAPTVPDEDFFSLIVRLQSGRIEDQRSSIPVCTPSKTLGKGSGGRGNTSKMIGTPGKGKKGSKLHRSLRSKRQ